MTEGAAVAPGGAKFSGTTLALAAFAMWGCFPLYWRALSGFDPVTILAHRVLWSCAFSLVALRLLRKGSVRAAFADARSTATTLATGLLVTTNWLLYIVAVNTGNTVQASLGYYMTPVFNVVLGLLFLKERPGPLQLAAFALAAVGVVLMTASYGGVPWIALALMLTFGVYGLLKKTSSLDALVALAGETLVVVPAAFVVVVVSFLAGTTAASAFVSGLLSGQAAALAPTAALSPTVGEGYGAVAIALLVLAGPVTAFPLWLYALGAKRIPLYAVGFLQFVSPTMQLAIGVLVFGEPFGTDRLAAFGCIWASLAIYSLSFVAGGRNKDVREAV